MRRGHCPPRPCLSRLRPTQPVIIKDAPSKKRRRTHTPLAFPPKPTHLPRVPRPSTITALRAHLREHDLSVLAASAAAALIALIGWLFVYGTA